MWNLSTPPSKYQSNNKNDQIPKFRCRKVSSYQSSDDIKFSKKISERFDPSLSTTENNSQHNKIDYYRQPSREPARDPRDSRNLPRPIKEFQKSLLDTSGPEWIRGEPSRHILIEQISSNQIRTELNLYALLEDRFQLSDNEIINIQLLSINSEKLCASVLFSSGFKAWDLVRSFTKSPSGLNWTMKIDSGAANFERIKKCANTSANINNNNNNNDLSNDKYRYKDDHYSSSSYKQPSTSYKSSCNPFVPCLKIPFSCERKLPFRLDKTVLISLFPISRFPSFSGIEEGGSSWHCHFGREIDVVEADKMFLTDVFVWKEHEFFFDGWKLVKGDVTWTIPDHYNVDKHKNSMEVDTDGFNAKDADADILQTHLPSTTSVMTDDFILKLPKFIKKRTKSEVEMSDLECEPCESKPFEDVIKVKVKRKPLKKQPFVPPSTVIKTDVVETLDTTETVETETVPVISEPMIIEVHEEIECQILNSGSARTEGFFQLSKDEKRRVKFNGILEAFSSSTSATSSSANSGVNADSRTSRAQNRRPILLPSATNITMDLFKVSPLQSAQKLVALRDSSIHSYGLVLMESAETGDLIIEYVGELVRASVANIREWKYEREYCGDGIASSYLFRLDEIMVIDANHQGNLARFINHSCDPNCVAKTITLNGSKRIVMYAKKSIRPGEEITYDYKFPTEKDPKKKVKCLCGTSSCRKYLN